MSVRISALLLGAALALTVTAAAAAEDLKSANAMLQGCQDFADPRRRRDGDIAQGFCAGSVYGIVWAGGYARYALKRAPSLPKNDVLPLRVLCLDIPDTATLSQEIKVVISYIEARPAQMHESFLLLAIEALRAAWPCK